jgi:oxygen-independent coproporphyrinogen-3 oxidase
MIDIINNNKKAPTRLGLYIHIPFCRTKCLYCDFCSFVSRDADERERYVDALLREIEARGTKEYVVDTVYFGGGTPSLLSIHQIGRILGAVRENFTLADDVEITLECNPMTHLDDGKEYFSALCKLGVNRLSLGVQSAVDKELKLIGRRHTFDEAKRTFFDARESGFDNISIDLMFGIPSQTVQSLEYSLEEFISLGAEHISIYSLQLEEGTPLHRMQNRYEFADDDAVADMYLAINQRMKAAGYIHYEISNFAKEGRESRHNSKYWRLNEYLGLGLSAHSDFGGERSENTSDLADYLEGKYYLSGQDIGIAEREVEFIMLGLRMSDGISKSEYFERFGSDFDEKYKKKINDLLRLGFVSDSPDRFALTERGFAVSNMILSQILDFDY